METASSKTDKAAVPKASAISEIEDDELEDLEEIDESFDKTQEGEESGSNLVGKTDEDSNVDLVPKGEEASKGGTDLPVANDTEDAGHSARDDAGKTDENSTETVPGSSCDRPVEGEGSVGREEVDSGGNAHAATDEDATNEEDLTEEIVDIADFIKTGSAGDEKEPSGQQGETPPVTAATRATKRKRKPKTKKSAPKKAKVVTDAAPTDSIVSTPKRSSTCSSVKPVQNWQKVLRLPASLDDRLTSAQIFSNVLPSYVPHVPKGTSERLINYLTDTDVELLSCPGCKDHFVLPTTFFQHIYRRSVEIAFSCQSCDRVMSFHNRCHLKLHILSHLEVDGVASVASDFVNVNPLGEQDLGLGFLDDSYERELDQVHRTCHDADADLVQCPECRLSVHRDALQGHFERAVVVPPAGEFGCDQCPMVLPNPCSQSAHCRIHKRMPPYVCPDCGAAFQTPHVFQRHVESSCHHDARTLAMECRICVQKKSPQPFIDARDILSHIYDSHVKLYYKCSSCPKAFDNKAATYAHRDQMHALEDGEKSDFSLLYKATFLRTPGNLFNTRESFERKMTSVTKRWSLSALYKCVSCQTYFGSREDIASHNRKWCGLQHGAAAANSSSLFQGGEQVESDLREKRTKLDGLIAEFRALLGGSGDCGPCDDAVLQLQNHALEHLGKQTSTSSSAGGGGRQCDSQGSIAETDRSPTVPPSRVTRRPPRRSSNSRESVNIAAAIPPPPATPPIARTTTKEDAAVAEEEVPKQVKVEVKEENNRVPASKKKKAVGRLSKSSHHKSQDRVEVKPFVESLGKDLPSSRRILAFNQLDKRALALGSSVVDSQRSLKRGRAAKHCCALCDFGTDQRENFMKHIRMHRPAESTPGEYFQCKECGMSFASESGWRKHLFLLHRIKKPDPGDYCADLVVGVGGGGQSKDPFSFSEEDDSSSGGEPPLTIDEGEVFRPRTNVCKVCARAFSTPLELRRHFRAHGMAFLMTAKNK